jgi:hypothetical protein
MQLDIETKKVRSVLRVPKSLAKPPHRSVSYKEYIDKIKDVVAWAGEDPAIYDRDDPKSDAEAWQNVALFLAVNLLPYYADFRWERPKKGGAPRRTTDDIDLVRRVESLMTTSRSILSACEAIKADPSKPDRLKMISAARIRTLYYEAKRRLNPRARKR